MWERFRHERPTRPRAILTADGFQQRFEAAYCEEMQWRIDRGGVTEEEIRRCVEAGGGEFSQEHCELVQRAWQMRIAQHLDEQLRAAFLEGSSLSLAEYERQRERLIFVHDRTAPDQLLIYLDSEADDDEEDDEDVDADEFDPAERMRQRCQAASPRVVFRELLEAGELSGRYERVREMTTPFPADVYVASLKD